MNQLTYVLNLITWICAMMSAMQCLTCLNCLKINHPRFCTHVTHCNTGEECGIEKIVYPSGETVFNVGCFAGNTCSVNDSVGSSQDTTCRQCCSSNLCNQAGCGESGITHARGPICYDCDGMMTSNECKTISGCEIDQACYIEEQRNFGETFYSTSCQNKNICNSVPIVGKRDWMTIKRSTSCHRCCDNDLCNNWCSNSVTTATTSTTNQPTTVSEPKARDCTDLRGQFHKSSIYHIYPTGNQGYRIYCDMVTDGGGWTVFQRRFNGTVNFVNRVWKDYSNGFGSLLHEYWLGNERVHQMTSHGRYELRVELTDWENKHAHAVYKSFMIGTAASEYTLHIGNYSGNAGDSLSVDNNNKFTTSDNDNDAFSGNCAIKYNGGWWYGSSCGNSKLTGMYANSSHGVTKGYGIFWHSWRDYDYSLKETRMMIRRY